MAALLLKNKEIQISTGAKISIRTNGKSVKIVESERNKFMALFDDDDVDFQLQINNSERMGKTRGLRVGIKTLEKEKKFFYIRPKFAVNLRTMESNGGKFHFVSQDSSKGKQLVRTASTKLDLSVQEASLKISRMELEFKLEQDKCKQINKSEYKIPVLGEKVQIFIIYGGSVYTALDIGNLNTVEDMKYMIWNSRGLPVDEQRLTFAGRPLEDGKTLSDYNITKGNNVYLSLRCLGGSSISSSIKKPSPIKEDNSVRGAICFGEKSDQVFKPYKCDVDESIKILPITLEFHYRKKSFIPQSRFRFPVFSQLWNLFR